MFRKSRSRYAKERDERIEAVKMLHCLGFSTRLRGKDFYERVGKEFYRNGLERRREMRKKIFSKDS